MEIKTKYSIGEEVYCCVMNRGYEYDVVLCHIDSIRLRYNGRIEYHVKEESWNWYSEKDIYKDKPKAEKYAVSYRIKRTKSELQDLKKYRIDQEKGIARIDKSICKLEKTLEMDEQILKQLKKK